MSQMSDSIVEGQCNVRPFISIQFSSFILKILSETKSILQKAAACVEIRLRRKVSNYLASLILSSDKNIKLFLFCFDVA